MAVARDTEAPEWARPAVEPVAPGVYRIPLPLPNDVLRAVNVYALLDEVEGLTMIDAGWALVEARTRLREALGELDLDLGDIRRFLVTHVHRDHYSQAVGLLEPAPAEQPLRAYLGSLRVVRALPDLRLAPAHGPVTDSAHARIDELLAHHRRRLDACAAAVAGGSGLANEVAQRLAWTSRARRLSELDPFNQMLAVLETAAHLDVLVAQGVLRSAQVDGSITYTH